MIIYVTTSISMAAVIALLISIIIEHKHDSEERYEEMNITYFICEGIKDKRKTYIAIPKEAMAEMPAKKFANQKHFKTKEDNLISTLGYIKKDQLYFGLIPEDTKESEVKKMWIIYRNTKKEVEQ